MTERMYDVTMDLLADGTICFTQQVGIDDPSVIDLHPEQLRILCMRAGLLEAASGTPAYVLRRLQRLCDDADSLYRLLASIPSLPPREEEDEDAMRARRLVEDIEALIDDLDGADAVRPAESQPSDDPP